MKNSKKNGEKKHTAEEKKAFRVVNGTKSEADSGSSSSIDRAAANAERLMEEMESKKKQTGKYRQKKTDDSGKKAVVILSVVAVLLVAAVIYLAVFRDKPEQDDTKKADQQSTEDSTKTEGVNQGYITYKGEKYQYNSNLKTMLFMGVDKEEVATLREMTGRSGQTDCLILLIMDQEDKEVTLLEIPRDSMVYIDIYGMDGEILEKGAETGNKAQIALQYAYGRGEGDSCRLTVDLVSELLYGIKINDYLSLNMAGIAPIVDAIGGVEITVPHDYTWVDPAFQEGAELTLGGEQAYWYVRKRDVSKTGSNLDRMERQTQFIQALFEKVSASEDNARGMLAQFWSAGEDYMTTNLNLKTLEKLTTYIVEPEIIKVPGEVREGEKHDEFYVDEDALKEMVIEKFYKKIE